MRRRSAGSTSRMADKQKLTLVVFSGDLDKVLAAFNISTGAASLGMDVTIFFTFWGLNAIRKAQTGTGGGIMQKMLTWMNKGGADRLPLSRFHMFGMGTWMMKKLMGRYRMPLVKEMIEMAKSMGVKIIACTITMGVMGLRKEDLIPQIDEYAGVVTYLASAKESGINLFI